jgi:subtilase family serine protease
LILFRPEAGTSSPGGETPATIRPVYNLPPTGGSGIIAIVDAFDYPTAANDFDAFSKQFGLPLSTDTVCNGANPCFRKVYASGTQPPADCGWSQEAALDIEWAHAMAPQAQIVLVEAASSSIVDLFDAVNVASSVVSGSSGTGSGEVSMSWGASEFFVESIFDLYFAPFPAGLSPTGVVYFAASGDAGGKTIYPGVSPYVVCAGGTTIHRDSQGNFTGETGWSGSGGGRSKYETRPAYQNIIVSMVGTHRGAPDFSFDADPHSGVSVYDSTPCNGLSGWLVFGGTSVSAQALAGIVNLAGHFYMDTNTELSTIYADYATPSRYAVDFRDILSGKAGTFTAKKGWDFVTGVGTNQGLNGK